MICLVCPTVWKTFITSNSKFIKTEKEQLISNMFNSRVNKFEYNELVKNVIDFYFSDQDETEYDFLDIINQIIIYRNDNDLLVTDGDSIETKTLLDHFKSESSLSNIFLVDDPVLIENEGVVNYSKIKSNNFSWFLSRLISQKPGDSIQLNQSDFVSDHEIERMISHIFNVKRIPDRKIYIQNSYQNLGGILNFLKGKRVIYHTSLYNNGNLKTEAEKQIERSNIKSFFTNKSVVKYSRNKSIVHPRNVVYGNFVLRTDNDFCEIVKNNRNWFVNISICYLRRDEILKILNEYN